MNKLKQKFKLKNIPIYLLMSLILALFIQIVLLSKEDNAYSKFEFNSINNSKEIVNYDVNGKTFTAQNNDPQLLFRNINSKVGAIEIEFLKPVDNNIKVQIYFAKNGENLSEENSRLYSVRRGSKKIIVEIPYNDYSQIRADIGSNPGESFQLNDIKICKDKITFFKKLLSRIEIINVVYLICIMFVLLNMIEKCNFKISSKQNRVLEFIFIIFCFTIFTLWARIQPYNSCPDEYMRYDVIKYVFDYNKLPHGGDPLIRDKTWGFSYAFVPYLSGLVSVVFMKILSIFTMNELALFISARMAVVCFGTVTVYYIIKIANKLFKDEYKWLFTILISCLPQFVFLGSYINNDMLSLMSIAMMIYYWIEGNEKKWDIKSNIGLAISVSICLLSYYNAYPFVLFSVVYFIWSNINNKSNNNTILKKFMIITGIVFVLAGWWFIRNGLIYNGDFLGLRTTKEYSNMYAIESLKVINRLTPLKQGVSPLFMLIKMGWVKNTYLSLIGCFGYMSIPLFKWMYKFYTFIFFIGIVAFIVKLINFKTEKTDKYIFGLCMTLSGIVTILLSIYNSYTNDFQAQGRYIMSCIIPLSMFTTIGFNYMFDYIENRLKINTGKVIFVICTCCILISIVCLTSIIIPMYK